MKLTKKVKLLWGLVVWTTLGIAASAPAQTYILTEIGTFGGLFSKAEAINDLGQVTGLATFPPTDFIRHAFLWEDGELTDLGTLGGGFSSYGHGINNQSQVVGRSDIGGGFYNAFLWQDGVMMDLGTPYNVFSDAMDINDAGQITGTIDLDAYRWEDGVWTELGTLPGFTGSSGMGINSSGEVVGGLLSCFFCPGLGFHWVEGDMSGLDPLPGYDSSGAMTLNDTGQIAGASAITIPSTVRATLWDNGEIIDLGVGPGTRSKAFGINSEGVIVGYWGTSHLFVHQYATLWQDGDLIDLNDRIPADSGWQLSQARDINDSGQICGFGYNPDGLLRGFLLTPCAPADFDCDGTVGAFDLAVLLGNWGPCPDPDDCPADFDDDGAVNAFDLAQLLGSWGSS